MTMNELEWQGNSREMVKAILNGVPSLFRGSVKQRINRWINRHNIQIVTEDLVFKAVDDIAPPDLARTIKPKLEKLRS